ncbi:MAG: hypothetical protein J5794_00565 [Lachnospiraceae bacterium]|nr:hypothetical protein [Lachnospiraceae bacterium]
METTRYCYCVFCRSEKCERLRKEFEVILPCRAIYPKQMHHVRVQGNLLDVERPFLPGYLFLYAEEPLPVKTLYRFDGVLRCLQSDDRNYELCGKDREFALLLLQNDGVFGKLQVFEEGNRIRIKEGAFAGIEAEVLKVDRRKGRLKVSVPLAGTIVTVWAGYETVEAASQSSGKE